MAGAEQNSVTNRVDGEGVHLACMVAAGGSVSKSHVMLKESLSKFEV